MPDPEDLISLILFFTPRCCDAAPGNSVLQNRSFQSASNWWSPSHQQFNQVRIHLILKLITSTSPMNTYQDSKMKEEFIVRLHKVTKTLSFEEMTHQRFFSPEQTIRNLFPTNMCIDPANHSSTSKSYSSNATEGHSDHHLTKLSLQKLAHCVSQKVGLPKLVCLLWHRLLDRSRPRDDVRKSQQLIQRAGIVMGRPRWHCAGLGQCGLHNFCLTFHSSLNMHHYWHEQLSWA